MNRQTSNVACRGTKRRDHLRQALVRLWHRNVVDKEYVVQEKARVLPKRRPHQLLHHLDRLLVQRSWCVKMNHVLHRPGFVSSRYNVHVVMCSGCFFASRSKLDRSDCTVQNSAKSSTSGLEVVMPFISFRTDSSTSRSVKKELEGMVPVNGIWFHMLSSNFF